MHAALARFIEEPTLAERLTRYTFPFNGTGQPQKRVGLFLTFNRRFQDYFAGGVQIRISPAFKAAGIIPAARYVSAIRCCSPNCSGLTGSMS
jgi:hypothetical protein